jgi:hypothetical protein
VLRASLWYLKKKGYALVACTILLFSYLPKSNFLASMARKNHSTLPQEDIEEFRKDNGCMSPCGGEVEVQLSELGLTWRSTLSEKDAKRIRRTYRVPSEVAIRISDDGEPAVPREDGETVVYEEMFKARL